MQVFIIGTPLETAHALDARRLNKQIIEAQQILDAAIGFTIAWAHHPCVQQYKWNTVWLNAYKLTLYYYQQDAKVLAAFWNSQAEAYRPDFHTPEYFDQMKRRLYTKDPNHYAQWAHLGTSEVNWYFVDGEWRHYRNGKLIKSK